MTEISIIIPVSQNTKYLAVCLDSLQKQTMGASEIIIVGDGWKPRVRPYKNLKVISQNHQGPGAARNLGVKNAVGKILVFVDADMKFDSNFLQVLTNPILKNKFKGTFSSQEYVGNWDNVWARCWNYQFNLKTKRRIPEDFGDQSPVFRAILKSEFDRVGGFNISGYDDDWSLSQKLGYKAQKTEARYYHFNPDNLSQVFSQAKWRVKRHYRWGFLGRIASLLKYFLPVSLFNSVRKAVIYKTPEFFIFGLVFDFGSFVGLSEQIILGKNY